MIIELFGLPGSGKTTAAEMYAAEGAVFVRAPHKSRIVAENVLFCLRYPIKAIRLFFFILKHAPSVFRYSLLMNLFLVQNAKYEMAKRQSRRGATVVLDQGHFQTLLSVFGRRPTDSELRHLLSILPRPGLLLIFDTPGEEREKRLHTRGWSPREEFEKGAVEESAHVAEDVYARVPSLFTEFHIPYHIVVENRDTALTTLLTEYLTYVTIARMPTEKAHGISIAHMCASFAKQGVQTSLVVPARKNSVTTDVFSFYGVPKNFSVIYITVTDFIGSGFTQPFFFILQRLFYIGKLKNGLVSMGVVYTREPEVAWHYRHSHRVVFEAHRWPTGFRGWLQGWLVRGSALVVCNSEGTERAAKENGLTRTMVAPNGFDPALYESRRAKTKEELGLTTDEVLVLYAGSTLPGKGVEVFRDAAAHVHAKGRLMVLGGKVEDKESKVVELGRVDPKEVPAYLMAADILVLPNTRETEESIRFTSPIKLFEYIGAGKAIIASDLPSLREVVSAEDVLLVPPGDGEALGKAIDTLIGDPERRKALGKRAEALAEHYTWEARAGQIISTLEARL